MSVPKRACATPICVLYAGHVGPCCSLYEARFGKWMREQYEQAMRKVSQR